MTASTLKTALRDWVDWDVAEYQLAVALGLMEPEPSAFTDAKHVFWSDHPAGNALFKILESLTALGVLDRRDEPDIQFRWSRDYRGTWE